MPRLEVITQLPGVETTSSIQIIQLTEGQYKIGKTSDCDVICDIQITNKPVVIRKDLGGSYQIVEGHLTITELCIMEPPPDFSSGDEFYIDGTQPHHQLFDKAVVAVIRDGQIVYRDPNKIRPLKPETDLESEEPLTLWQRLIFLLAIPVFYLWAKFATKPR